VRTNVVAATEAMKDAGSLPGRVLQRLRPTQPDVGEVRVAGAARQVVDRDHRGRGGGNGDKQQQGSKDVQHQRDTSSERGVRLAG